MTAFAPIPAKRYFTIGEVAELCGVKPHVLRYWEQEFTQLRPMKRSGNRRYYQRHEVMVIRRIRELLYDEGFTIQGARSRIDDYARPLAQIPSVHGAAVAASTDTPSAHGHPNELDWAGVRAELLALRSLIGTP